MTNILLLPFIEVIVVGALAGLVGVLAVLNRQVFYAEAITHATFPGAVLGVVAASSLGLNHSWMSIFLFAGALLMCIPIGALFGLSRVGTTSAAAGIVLTSGFALGYFLNKWFAPLPVKVESFLVGSVLNVSAADVLLASVLLAAAAIVVAARWRTLVYFAFDRSSYGVNFSSARTQLLVSALIVVTLIVLIPAVGTIVSIAFVVAPAAALFGVVRTPRTLLIAAPALGILIGLSGLAAAVWMDLSAGGCIGVSAGVVYLVLKIASARNETRI